jgi:DNA-binding CsgD family transcriptional regulator
VHPGFLQRVRQLAPDISQAEMRMAVLMRLQFDNKQMAGILGIGVESVSKAKRRLRQRLDIPPNIAPEKFIQTISPHFSIHVPPA